MTRFVGVVVAWLVGMAVTACTGGPGGNGATGGGSGGSGGSGGQTYRPCASNQECPVGESCFKSFSNGLCTKACVSGPDCSGTDVCTAVMEGNACTRHCVTDNDCRADLRCTSNGACGGLMQSPECRAVVDCSQKTGFAAGFLDGGEAEFEGTYGPRGTCWVSAATAAACTSACDSTVMALRSLYPDAGC
jgi:hypothetical protein